IVGDWNNDGRTKLGCVRANPDGTAVFSLDTNGDGVFDAGDQVFTFGYASDTFLVGRWRSAPALTAAGGVPSGAAAPPALDAAFRAEVDAALALWSAAGLDAASLARLRGLTYSVGTLGGATTALSDGGSGIELDATAAGNGWSEGAAPEPGKIDLTTALAH